jgi:sigma-E factor negative regulatory protein RseB
VIWYRGSHFALWALCALLPVASWALEPDAGLSQWLLRVHEASRHRAYTGTFVVSAGGNLASAKIWHVCDGTRQVERVEPLTGVPRATYRRDDQVITLYPQSRVAVVEKRESLGMFPALLKSTDAPIGDFYQFKVLGTERLAGFEADAVALIPKDMWRYAYRVWSEKRSGLVLQLQTVDTHGRVIEQSAFSELQLDAPVKMAQLEQQMDNTAGYRVNRPAIRAVTADTMGWNLNIPVPGFRAAGCFNRTLASNPAEPDGGLPVMQWIFTDGLATLSVFVESFDGRRHQQEGAAELGGATHIVTRKLGEWWATAVGEVPANTLGAFLRALERRK